MAAFGLNAIHPSSTATDDKPHILGYGTARSTSGLLLLDIWNGSSSASRKFCIDKDGNITTIGQIYMATGKRLYLDGGTDTYIDHTADNNIRLVSADAAMVVVDNPSVTILNDAVLICGTNSNARAPLRIPHGTAPASPVNGDVWTTTLGAFVRINGVTKSIDLT